MSNILEVQSLVKHYGDFQAVKGISFSIKEGEIFSLLIRSVIPFSTTWAKRLVNWPVQLRFASLPEHAIISIDSEGSKVASSRSE